MGWVWRDDAADRVGDEEFNVSYPKSPNNLDDSSSGDRCSTRRVVRSQCKTEEVEPGKFVRKCEKTEEILRDCLGKPVEVLKSNKEHTEEDVTHQVVQGNHSFGSLEKGPLDFPGLRSDIEANFPGLRSDIEAIERSVFGGIDRFFDAADEMRNSFFGIFGPPPSYDRESSSSPSMRRGIPIEGHPQKEVYPKQSEHDTKYADLSGSIRDV
ncbi:hypothetical protein HS088_TW03G00943 [Tripterygium wilfordii]|uniref:Mal d 1-associated protein n=1 Tax=Tripterygium wilfordii TaxID=458696 RepID=A0A7J7DWR4_TRIWF|nr:fra a 1-associated protein-like [Tripterygium wilfordii]KAF5750604.1 hypothetical protein HS088_TW03G00943 [Tripterygium wilfordii]